MFFLYFVCLAAYFLIQWTIRGFIVGRGCLCLYIYIYKGRETFRLCMDTSKKSVSNGPWHFLGNAARTIAL